MNNFKEFLSVWNHLLTTLDERKLLVGVLDPTNAEHLAFLTQQYRHGPYHQLARDRLKSHAVENPDFKMPSMYDVDTVSELIQELQKYPGDAIISVYQGEDNCICIDPSYEPEGYLSVRGR